MFSGLSIATSGIRQAHTNLGVVGHNISNAEIRGFSRQRIVQKEAFTMNLGRAPNNDFMMLGMGSDRNAIQQLRNEFLDFTYREHSSRLEFYSSIVTVGRTIENLLGELYGAYNMQTEINAMWYAIQELTRFPDGFANRNLLLSTANNFLNKTREVYNSLVEEQHNLNRQIIATTNEINDLVAEVNRLNDMISAAEMAGDNANDFRDARHLALDDLSRLIEIETRVNAQGGINIMSMGHELLNSGQQNVLGFRNVSGNFDFVIPVLGVGNSLISANTEPGSFVSFINFSHPINNAQGNDMGRLMALMMARGMVPANHMSENVPHPFNDLLDGNGNVVQYSRVNQLLHSLENADAANAGAVAILLGLIEDLNDDPGNAAIIDAIHAALDTIVTPDVFTEGTVSTIRDLVDNREARIYNHELYMWGHQNGMIPRVQINMDRIVYQMVNLINDAVTGQLREINPQYPLTGQVLDPDHPNFEILQGGRYRFVFRVDPDDNGSNARPVYDLNGEQGGVPIFIRRFSPDSTEVDPGNLNTIFSIENLMINPALQQPGGHNLIALSLDRDAVNDTRVLEQIQLLWRANESPYVVEIGNRHFRIQDAYVRMVNQISIDVNEAIRFVDNQTIQVIQADHSRQAIKGVSMDEELASMLRFQYAFQAASRVVNVIDTMIETVIRIGRG